MNHTTYYQLSLWEQDDRIMREDFNDNNAKIDAALASAINIDTLADIHLTSNAEALEIPLSNIDLSQYRFLEMTVMLLADSSYAFFLQLDDIASGYCFFDAGVNTNLLSSDDRGIAVLYPTFGTSQECHMQLRLFEGPNDSTICHTNGYHLAPGEANNMSSILIRTGICRGKALSNVQALHIAPQRAGLHLLPGTRVIVSGYRV